MTGAGLDEAARFVAKLAEAIVNKHVSSLCQFVLNAHPLERTTFLVLAQEYGARFARLSAVSLKH